MKSTNVSASRCRCSAAMRAFRALIARPVVTSIMTRDNEVTRVMRRMRRRCSRCLRTSNSTLRSPARILSLTLTLPSPPDRASAAIGSKPVGVPSAAERDRNAGGKHSSACRPAISPALGSPATITQKMRSARPIRRKTLISSLTQRERLALGEQITMRLAESCSALLIVSPRSVLADRSLRSRNTGASRLDRMPNAVCVPMRRRGTR